MYLVFSLLFFVLFIAPKFVAPAILVVFIYTVVQTIRKKIKIDYSNRFLLLPGLFVLYLIGCLYTENTQAIGFEIESRLSFVIFPILFVFIPYDEVQFRKTARIYLLIALLSSIFCLLNAISCESEFQYGGYCYLKKYLAYQLHTSYISLYYLFAIMIMIYYRLIKKPLFNISIEIIASFALLIFIFFFTSKAAYLSVFLTLFLGVLFLFFKKIKYYFRILWLALFVIIIAVFVFVPNPVKSKLAKSYDAVQSFNQNKSQFFESNKDKTESSAARLIIWSITWQEIKKYPLGVGTGDIKPHLIDQYRKLGFDKFAKNEYNPHNQYLQTGLSIGFPGIIMLLLLFILPMVMALRQKKYLFFSFLLIFSFNCLFESMLEVQAGIVFFSFIFSWFMKDLVWDLKKNKNAQ